MNDKFIETTYPETGLATPTGQISTFLRDIMHTEGHGGQECLDHLQRLLAYGITGHINCQIMVMMVGAGSAGKSLLLSLLRKLLGPFYKDVSKDMLVNSKGQRPPSRGAASPQEAGKAHHWRVKH
jgi:hypothetical protein